MEKGDNSTVLLIDDDLVVRDGIANFLSELSYRVVVASDTKEGLEAFHSAAPDLIICDMNLAGGSMLDFLRTIFSQVASQAVIVLSDKEVLDDVVEAMKLGASDYLIKPVNELILLQLSINSSLKRAHIIKENEAYRKRLEDINHALENNLELFQADQQAGRHVQISMLPKPPQIIADYEFNHRVVPSLFLSGDLVDYKPLSKSKVMFYIADVSGHGSSSAFITILLRFRTEQLRREYIKGRFSGDFTPAAILKSLNKDLLDTALDKHITMFLGILDREQKTLTYSVAGHHPLPVVYKDGKASFIELTQKSFPVGLLPEAEYFEQTIPFEKCSLTLCSDGILESLPQTTLEDKEQRILQVVEQCGGEFQPIREAFGLKKLNNVPDDIAVMNVSDL
ncbi:MAG: fused response regulator/phosphatase [Gammaproteobacteria bacterium]|nr:fused response regulator/phosphatase [Gammaproteobacteria bacterium]|tara:strand:+ start:108618 stop:109802 length:1185 start_codon:yes stop_codon:yes gene_type:complete